ncbi:MAG: type IV pilin N-terminal domain-containing protein [Halobacteriales archaeon]|nr:type IV pilin N-terminal domain-containing protein [Halobacteriales archaeon]
MKDGTTNCRTERTVDEDCEAVSPVIGVILMVSVTVLVAATVGALLTGSALVGEGVEEPTTGGVTFNYDYDANSDMMRVSITHPGNVERLYIGKRGGGFEDGDIVRATGGWLDQTADRNSGGSIVDGEKLVNEEVGAGDQIILDNVTAEDSLVLTGDKGKGTGETLVSNWEANDWTYRG